MAEPIHMDEARKLHADFTPDKLQNLIHQRDDALERLAKIEEELPAREKAMLDRVLSHPDVVAAKQVAAQAAIADLERKLLEAKSQLRS